MAAAQSVLIEKVGVNFRTLVSSIVLSGSYTQTTGESINLTGATIPNVGAVTVTGPNVALTVPPRLSAQLGGYDATLTPTATPLVYTLRFWTSGGTELGAGAYPAALTAGPLTVETDFAYGSDFGS